MVPITGELLALIIFLGICACGLALFGFSNIRSGLHRGSQEQVMQEVTAAWYKQPKVLFGINNIIFALILALVLLLILLADQTAHYIVVGLIAFTLIISIVLVVLSIRAAIGTLQHLSIQQKQQKN